MAYFDEITPQYDGTTYPVDAADLMWITDISVPYDRPCTVAIFQTYLEAGLSLDGARITSGTVDIARLPTGAVNVYPTCWEATSQAIRKISGNPYVVTIQYLSFLCHFAYISPPASTDVIELDFCLAAGSYTLQTIGLTNNDHPIVDFAIDGVSQGTIDYHSASLVWAATKTLAVTVLTSGNHTLRLTYTGSTSGNYSLGWSHFSIK